MGTYAWQRREYERQKFLEELTTLYYNFECTTGGMDTSHILLTVLVSILDYLRASDIFQVYLPKHDRGAMHFVNHQLLRRVGQFARSEEERYALLGQFANNLLKSYTSGLDGRLNTAQAENPQLILHASHTLEIVPLN